MKLKIILYIKVNLKKQKKRNINKKKEKMMILIYSILSMLKIISRII